MIKEGQAKIKFTYNRSTRKVTVDVKQGAMVWITGDIAAVLGFGDDSVLTEKTTSPFVADIIHVCLHGHRRCAVCGRCQSSPLQNRQHGREIWKQCACEFP